MKRLAVLFAGASIVAGSAAIAAPSADAAHRLSGVVIAASSNVMLLRSRQGRQVTVDLSEARAHGHVGVLAKDMPVVVYGSVLSDGTFHCVRTGHTAADARYWDADR